MPLCRDPGRLLPLLDAARPASESCRNLVLNAVGGGPVRIWVDSLEQPRAVIVRSRRQTLFAADARSAGRAVRELPRNLRFAFGATPSRFRRVVTANWPGRRPPRSRLNSCWQYHLEPGRLVADHRHRIVGLVPSDAEVISRFRPHGRNPHYVAARIAAFPGVGIRARGRLVAWGLTHDDGSMGFLHVLEEFRRRGMARSLTCALARRLLDRGILPFMYIMKTNVPSLKATAGMGFSRGGSYDWFGMRPSSRRTKLPSGRAAR